MEYDNYSKIKNLGELQNKLDIDKYAKMLAIQRNYAKADAIRASRGQGTVALASLAGNIFSKLLTGGNFFGEGGQGVNTDYQGGYNSYYA